MSKGKILIVEDERLAAESLKEIVIRNGYEVVDICSRGKEAIKAAIKYKPDLIFMDIMLKDNISGSEAALQIQTMIDTKIIFISGHYDDEMLEYAIESNAANYITKPYQQKQIEVAIKIALKKQKNLPSNNLIKLKGGFIYDLNSFELLRNNVIINLNPKESSLIKYLCTNIDSVLTYKQCNNCLYGNEYKLNALRTIISRLHKKLGFNLIENINGVGYKISSFK